MKKNWKSIISIVLLVKIFLFLVIYQVYAGPLFNGQRTNQVGIARSTTGAALDPNNAAVTGPGILFSIVVQTDGSNNCTVSVQDTNASGKAFVPASTVVLAAARIWTHTFTPGVLFTNGVYLTITAAGSGTCSALIHYDQ